MGILTKTTNAIFGSTPGVTERLLKVFTPCPPGDGSKTVNIKIFDEHVLVTEMATAQEIVTGLESFLNAMQSAAGLEAPVAASLSAITFQVNYSTTHPSQSEIDHFRRQDFPVYLLTHTGDVASPKEEIVSLLIAHKIPETTFVGKRRAGNALPVMAPIKPYKDLEKDWTEGRTILGFGMPGPYFVPNSQRSCRKLGIIKMRDFMTENVSPSNLKPKLLSVIEHELGHMFGLVHEPNTLMDENYKINSQFTQYTNDQLWVVSKTFEALTQP